MTPPDSRAELDAESRKAAMYSVILWASVACQAGATGEEARTEEGRVEDDEQAGEEGQADEQQVAARAGRVHQLVEERFVEPAVEARRGHRVAEDDIPEAG